MVFSLSPSQFQMCFPRFSPSCFALNPTMPSCLPDLVPQYFLTVSHLLSNCFRAASQMWSPSCLLDVSQVRLQDVVSQLPPRFLHLYVSRPVVAKMWSPSCLPHVVSQVLSPSCFQRFYTCCLVFHLSPRCGLPVVSQMWFPRCCLTVWWFWVVSRSFADVVALLSPTCLPDVLTYLPHVVSQVVS